MNTLDKRLASLKKPGNFKQNEADMFKQARLKKQFENHKTGTQVKSLLSELKNGEPSLLKANIDKEEIFRAIKMKETGAA